MYVIKRDGSKQPVSFDQILERIRGLCDMEPRLTGCEPVEVTKKVVDGVCQGVKTSVLDKLAAETAAYMASVHPHYADLAARISISDLQKCTEDSVALVIEKMRTYKSPMNGLAAPLISEDVYRIMMKHMDTIQATIDYSRDFNYDYFGFKTLERSYLTRCDGEIVERPQHMLMRVSFGIHMEDLAGALETYDWMSRLMFTHATPTLFNAGTTRPQMSSCFLLTMTDDSIEGIYDTLKRCALISKSAGGIGISVHKIRASSAYIRGTGGTSNGLVPMLRVYNDTARYVDQGGGKRKGAFAVYLEPWHADIFDFLDLKKNTGKEEARARDLFYGLWIPDLFMKRVEDNGTWSLFCPDEAPGLADVWGAEFEALYARYEAEGKARKQVRAQDLWFSIVESQIETGTPYMLFKDAANGKSNQQNLGTIRSSNLCTEIIEYTAPDEVAVCNLASIALPRFVDVDARTFDHAKFSECAKIATRNLNKVIDLNYYPVEEARRSNMRHRPIGLGIQGLADVFLLLRVPWESDEARALNRDIFETLYFSALDASCEIAEREGHYPTYPGSPASKGKLQHDLWGVSPATDRWDWAGLRERIAKHGLRNSLLVAPMPTASTSQILGNNECFEPYTSNIYTRRTSAGDFTVVNKHLVKDLVRLGIWSPELKNLLVAHHGSIQNISAIPDDLKPLYKTVWEISQRCVIDMAADRGAYVDQSQSLNLHVVDVSFAKLTSMHFYSWKKGLKTGMYYLRTKAAANAIQFTVDKAAVAAAEDAADTDATATPPPSPKKPASTPASPSKMPITAAPTKSATQVEGAVCYMEEGCLMCGS